MTKKHYEAIAVILKYENDTAYTDEQELAIDNITFNLADYFQTDNKNFDRARFLQACGIIEPN